MTTLTRISNVLVGAVFATVCGYAVYDQVADFITAQPEHIVAIGGILAFLAFTVLAWFVIDKKAPRAL